MNNNKNIRPAVCSVWRVPRWRWRGPVLRTDRSEYEAPIEEVTVTGRFSTPASSW